MKTTTLKFRISENMNHCQRFISAMIIVVICLISRAEISIAETDGVEDEQFIKTIQQLDNPTLDMKMLFQQNGKSSWYHNRFHNKKTSNGERYHKDKFTAAHKTLPFGTIVKVENSKNHEVIFVRVNDRGPFSKSKIIDLSKSASKALGNSGNHNVKIQALLPKKYFIDSEEASKYFLAFSYNDTPKCFLAKYLNIITEYDDFDEAVEEFAKIHKYNKPSNMYLLTSPDIEPDFHDDEEIKGQYYIGFFKDDIELSYSKLIML